MVQGVREVNELEGIKGSKRSEGPKGVVQLPGVERCQGQKLPSAGNPYESFEFKFRIFHHARGPRLPSAGNPIRCLAHHIPESRFRIRHESRIRKASQTLAAVRHSHPFIPPPPPPPSLRTCSVRPEKTHSSTAARSRRTTSYLSRTTNCHGPKKL